MAGDGIRTEMGFSTADRIVVRGLDLTEDVMGKIGLADMAFLEIVGRVPGPGESAVFDALLVTLVEHGITPSALAARLTLLGEPDALQAAVASGLLGVGGRFVGSAEGAARMLQEAQADDTEGGLEAAAEQIVSAHARQGRPIPGIGHPVHTLIDPRAPRLFAIARAHGFAGRHVELMQRVAERAATRFSRPLPVNATGAVGAVASELGVPWRITRGLAVISRAVGLVGHLAEELERPMAPAIWTRVDAEARAAAETDQ